jgi:predicted DNA-binding transcriptional regulator AlpA
MHEYDFTLKFALVPHDADPETCIESLMRTGCDDALIGIGKPGRIALDFSRRDETAEAAVLGALDDVRRAIPDARFVEAAPDYVGVPDIAQVLGVSRQYVGKLLKQHEPSFPSPTVAGVRSIWHLESILTWLDENGIREVDAPLREISRVTRRCNLAREHRQPGSDVPEYYRQAVG